MHPCRPSYAPPSNPQPNLIPIRGSGRPMAIAIDPQGISNFGGPARQAGPTPARHNIDCGSRGLGAPRQLTATYTGHGVKGQVSHSNAFKCFTFSGPAPPPPPEESAGIPRPKSFFYFVLQLLLRSLNYSARKRTQDSGLRARDVRTW